MRTEELFLLGVLAAMVGGVTIIVLGLRSQAHRNELRHQERMAMIERGMVPPPEMGGWAPGSPGAHVTFRDQRRAGASRSQMTFGIVLIGAGLAFMAIVGIAADTPSVAIGIGGAILIFGAALIVISQVVRPTETMTTHYPRPPIPNSPLPSQMTAPPPVPPDQNP